MREAGTTILPHGDPARPVETGIFCRSHNPIYTGEG
jgi:hypothetical protein